MGKHTIDHRSDSDCVVIDLSTMSCADCGVYHGGDPCSVCDGVAFHEPGCPRSDATAQEYYEAYIAGIACCYCGVPGCTDLGCIPF